MGTFFNGWRHKAGVVTLGLACVFATGWVRSTRLTDVFQYPEGSDVCYIMSSNGECKWSRVNATQGGRLFETRPHQEKPEWYSYPTIARDPNPRLLEGVGWHRELFGFRFRAYVVDEVFFDIPIEEWAIPYWSLTLPLTFLSAYLLLWPHRRAKPPTPPSPI